MERIDGSCSSGKKGKPGNSMYPLVMTNIAMENLAHRNRWFTYGYLLQMGIFDGYVK